jgi:hypothetical protein
MISLTLTKAPAAKTAGTTSATNCIADLHFKFVLSDRDRIMREKPCAKLVRRAR